MSRELEKLFEEIADKIMSYKQDENPVYEVVNKAKAYDELVDTFTRAYMKKYFNRPSVEIEKLDNGGFDEL